MEPFIKYTRVVDRLSEFLGEISKYVVVATIFVGFSNVVLRYVGTEIGRKLVNNTFIEAQWYLYSLIFLLGFAYILKNSINVRVDFWFAEQSKKRKAMIDLVGHFIALIPFCLLALYISIPPVITSFQQWELSPDPDGLPRAPIKFFIIVAFVTLLLQAIAEVIKLIAVLRDQEHLVKDALADEEAPIRVE